MKSARGLSEILSQGPEMRALVLFVAVFFVFGSHAKSDENLDDVMSHFKEYLDCGNSHFLHLGRKNARPFEEVESTVVGVCGQHIKSMVKTMDRIGMTNPEEQNDLLHNLIGQSLLKFSELYSDGQIETKTKAEESDIMSVWTRCLRVFASTVAATTNEPAEVIADAAMISCFEQQNDFFELANLYSPAMKKFRKEELNPFAYEKMRLFAVAEILKIKAMKRLQ